MQLKALILSCQAPESTSDAVDRIIATGREKADEIRSARADAIQDDIFDEEADHINNVVNMVNADDAALIQSISGEILLDVTPENNPLMDFALTFDDSDGSIFTAINL